MMPGHFGKKQLLGVDPIDVRFLEIIAKPWTDKRRITFQIRILPFNQAPSLGFLISDHQNDILSEVTIVETQDNEIEFTMHIPEKEHVLPLSLEATIKYEDLGIVDNRTITFVL
ncbi:MAG: hypothetical protein CVU46_05215 [Chloroflexi bacterium HGW-Chloroflexi-8]|jgi:hypothetical protein|nr:MAG: hypothetical protein CVU46_05215 [Chloroflexi bacterium HGW-Chloroflexi-8]